MSDLATADRNFVLQQGLEVSESTSCVRVSSALRFQPRLIALILFLGMVTQSAAVFAVLAALLWWSSLLPRWNPFDFVYNHTFGRRSGAPPLTPAPMPRRFAQGMAATFATVIAVSIAAEYLTLAWVLQAMFALAVAALVFARFCLGSFVYHLARGRVSFAISTLPWRNP